MPSISIDADTCKRCGACATTCPARVFQQIKPGTLPAVTSRSSACIGCSHCVAICPADSVRHEAFPPERVHVWDEARSASYEAVLELMNKRRSVRSFRSEPVSQEEIDKLLRAADSGPHAHNGRSTNILVVRDKAALAEVTTLTADYFRKMAGQLRNPIVRRVLRLMAGRAIDSAVKMLPELDLVLQAVDGGNDVILRDAPCLFLFHAPKSGPFNEVNVQLVLHNVALATEALGLGGFYTGFVIAACRRDNAIARRFDVPADHKIMGGFALGHPRLPFAKWAEREPLPARTI